MNYIYKHTQIFLLLVFIATSAVAQDNINYQASKAVMLQVSENIRTENILTGVTVGLQNNSSQLVIKLNLPYDSLNHTLADNGNSSASTSTGLPFELKVNIDPVGIHKYLTSAKTFSTRGYLTLNDSTKTVMVDYMPLPSGTDLDGNFNLSIVVQFKPDDFNLTDVLTNSNFIIKINNTPVNRL